MCYKNFTEKYNHNYTLQIFIKVVFGWTNLTRFTDQEDGFEEMKVVWLTWFGRMDEERFWKMKMEIMK